MRNLVKKSSLISIVFLVPTLAFADLEGSVKNVLSFCTDKLFPLFVLFYLGYAGVAFASKAPDAKDRLTHAVIGAVIVLGLKLIWEFLKGQIH